MLPFEIKQVHIPSKLLPFEQKGPAALATVRTRLPALACSSTHKTMALISTHVTTALETGVLWKY